MTNSETDVGSSSETSTESSADTVGATQNFASDSIHSTESTNEVEFSNESIPTSTPLSKSEKNGRIRPYEAVILMVPDSSLEDQKQLFRKNKSIIEEFGGNIHTLETWGKRNLANMIGKHKKAVYFYSAFMGHPNTISELERTMRINDKVMRFMHTRLDERIPIEKHVENFKNSLLESSNREKEREAKALLRKQQLTAERAERMDRPERSDRPERMDRPDRV